MDEIKLIGPFSQLLTMDNIPLKGSIADDQLEIIKDAGMLVKGGNILETGRFKDLLVAHYATMESLEEMDHPVVAMPGLMDAHTHICWAGSRAGDYALRLAGKNYLEISAAGGGIWHTVTHVRGASVEELAESTALRAEKMLQHGITTAEVKSGYGLDMPNELKMLESIRLASEKTRADLVPTCLAAHIRPRDFNGSSEDYLLEIIRELLPAVLESRLARRTDIYIDEGAFTPDEAIIYLTAARNLGFELVVHADQFSRGGAEVAVAMKAMSADHLEVSTDTDIKILAESGVIPVALPGSSLGLGIGFAPARKLLNAGASLAIASDWNPGSAPMGNLLAGASILGIFEKLSTAEILSGITYRAAAALNLKDRGILRKGMLADIIAFPGNDYREILYNQGQMEPELVWKRGVKVKS
jgi:imidazolonepropionase